MIKSASKANKKEKSFVEVIVGDSAHYIIANFFPQKSNCNNTVHFVGLGAVDCEVNNVKKKYKTPQLLGQLIFGLEFNKVDIMTTLTVFCSTLRCYISIDIFISVGDNISLVCTL